MGESRGGRTEPTFRGPSAPGARPLVPALHFLLFSSLSGPGRAGPAFQGPSVPSRGPLFQHYTFYYSAHFLVRGDMAPPAKAARVHRPREYLNQSCSGFDSGEPTQILEIPISKSLQLSTIVCRDLAVAWILGIPISQSLQLSTIVSRDLAVAWILEIPISQSL